MLITIRYYIINLDLSIGLKFGTTLDLSFLGIIDLVFIIKRVNGLYFLFRMRLKRKKLPP